MERETLASSVPMKFAEHAGPNEQSVFIQEMTLNRILKASEQKINKLEVMENSAKTANALNIEYGARVQRPTLLLDTNVSRVLIPLLDQAEQAEHAH